MSTVLNPSYALTLGNVRSLVVPSNTNEASPGLVGVDPRGAMYVSQDLPERAELARLGSSVIMRTDSVACVTAMPTTAAAHTLWNGESPGGKSYVIDRITWICATSAAAASSFAMVAVVNKASTATVPATADTVAQTVYSTGKGYAGKAKVSHTVTVVDDIWFPLGQTFTTALTATVGSSLDASVNGMIVLAPGYVLGVSVIAVNTTAKGTLAFWFHEAQLGTVTS
jgi:hypothetical protein